MPAIKRKIKGLGLRGVSTAATSDSPAVPESLLVDPAAKPRRVLRGKRGSLQNLPTMPLDILFEVFSHMCPLDLLNLARTSKDFRDLLMSKNSATFWKAARKNVDDLPDCPPFMSEPAFANLVFSSHCHRCLKPHIKTVLWDFLARFCSGCKDIMTLSLGSIHIPGFKPWDSSILLVLPFITERGKSRYALETKVLLRDVDDLKKELASVSHDPKQEEAVVEARKERTKELQKFASSCNAWYEERKESRSEELDSIRQKRLQAVVEKLGCLGWGEELKYMKGSNYYGLSRLAPLKQAKLLTDRTWANMRETVESYMKEAKEIRLLAVRREALKERIRTLRKVVHKWRSTFDGLLPHVRDLLDFPEVRAIIDVQPSTTVTEESFSVLEPILPDLLVGWRKSFDENLQEHFRTRASPECAKDVDLLTLATMMLFQCTRCLCIRTYPGVLTHCCRHYFMYDENTTDVYSSCADSVLSAKSWNPKPFSIPSKEVAHMVSLCDKDASRTTIAEMDALDARFVCEACDGNGIETVMTWRSAALHVMERHRSGFGQARLVKASDEHATIARSVEQAAAEKVAAKADARTGGGWCCSACDLPRYDSKADVLRHLGQEHGKTEDYLETDFYRQSDSCPLFSEPVYLVSSKLELTYLPLKISAARDSGLVSVQDDIPLERVYKPMGFSLWDDIDDDYGLFPYDHDPYDDVYGMSDEEDYYPFF